MKNENIYEFLHGKRYDESETWRDSRLVYEDSELNIIYSDGDLYSSLDNSNHNESMFRILLDALIKYPVERNQKLLQELQEKFP